MLFYVAVMTLQFGGGVMELNLYTVETKTAPLAAQVAFMEKFGQPPTPDDTFRDANRTSANKFVFTPGAAIDDAILGTYTFDRYGRMTGTIIVRKSPFPEQMLWG